MIIDWIRGVLYDHPFTYQLAEKISYDQKKRMLHDLCSRVSINDMRKYLDEAENSGHTYVTLANLLEGNYNKK